MNKTFLFLIFLLVFIAACNQQEVTSFDECVTAGNPILESYPRQCVTNGQTFTENLTHENACLTLNGRWFGEYNECEGISQEQCTRLGGTFNECASACRHLPPNSGMACTMQCIPLCIVS